MAAIGSHEHVLASRDTMDASLYGLGRSIYRITGVPRIEPGAWNPDMVRHGRIGVMVNRLRKVF
jgi:hypothetical protein